MVIAASTSTTVFSLTMTAWWQHAVFKSGTLLLSQQGCFFEAGGQGSPRNRHSVSELSWQRGGSMLSLVRNTVILQCIDVVGWAKFGL